jgi:transposase
MHYTREYILQSFISKHLSACEASQALKISRATMFRWLNKYKEAGGFEHGNKGKQNRKPHPNKDKIISLCQNKYANFSIAHTAELLNEREGISLSDETLRRWLKRKKTYKRSKYRKRREPMPSFGDLLQIDGSFEFWFGGTKSCLMHIVDDAAKTCMLHFEEQETIESACHCAFAWFKKYGIPKAFYADGRNMYHLLAGREPNFFTAMCERLGIKVILARSPQAKGRVERYNGVHQKRMIPLLELDNIINIKEANDYLKNYTLKHNKKFSIKPKIEKPRRPLPDWAKLIDDVCFIEAERKLNNDWTFSYKKNTYQINKQSKIYPPNKAKINLKINISGKITANYRSLIFNVV